MDELFRMRSDRRRKDRLTRPTWEPAALNQRHQEIINLTAMGLKAAQVAEALGITEQTVKITINSTLGKEKMALIRASRDCDTIDAAKKMQELIPKALEVYDKLLENEDGKASLALQKSVADNVLRDFSGLVVPKKVLVGNVRVTPELLDELKKNAKVAAKECGVLIDTTADLVAIGGS